MAINTSVICVYSTIAIALLAPLTQTACKRDAQLTVVSFGGAYQDAQRTAYIRPFSENSNIHVQEAEYNGEYGLLRQRATASTGAWDVVSVESGPCMRGGQEGIFLDLPAKVFEGKELVVGSKRPYAAGHLVFSTVLAFQRDTLSNPPQNWSDFWDIRKFPGKRGLRRNPRGTLEIALLADGVSPERLYPLDIARAFNKLDELRPHLVFWESGAQPIQFLANRTVVMTSAYNGRVWDAATKERLPIAWNLTSGLMEVEFWAVPKNSKNPEAAVDFISFSLDTERQAAFANMIAYGPTNKAAVPLISADILTSLPSSPDALPKQVPVNAEWWAANESKVSAQWDQWLQKH